MNALELRGVWFAYHGEPVLRGVDLTVEKGRSVALMGRNGAGKTTISRLVMGLLHPNRGDVSVGGVSTRGLRPEDLARHAAYVFQHADQQLFERTVRREVSFSARQLGRGEEGARQAMEAALALLQLTAFEDQHPYDLPPAARKLVALAAALAQEPALLVLDEPTQGLDRAGKQRVVTALNEFAADGGAVLAVTHDMWLVAELLERVVVLDGGRIVADEPARPLLADHERLGKWGLAAPPAAQISAAMRLAGNPIREDDVSRAIAQLIEGTDRTDGTDEAQR